MKKLLNLPNMALLVNSSAMASGVGPAPQPITFAPDGTIENGNHRAQAAGLIGTPVPTASRETNEYTQESINMWDKALTLGYTLSFAYPDKEAGRTTKENPPVLPMSFKKGLAEIWYNSQGWCYADLYNSSTYSNHCQYRKDLNKALETHRDSDTTKGYRTQMAAQRSGGY